MGRGVPFDRRDLVRRVNKDEWHGYYEKALQFMETAQDALDKGNLTPAASSAIHAAINACDAAMIWHTGERSQGAHANAPRLFREYFTSPEGIRASRLLSRLIRKKTETEYEQEEPTPEEAAEMVGMAQEVLGFAAGKLPLAK